MSVDSTMSDSTYSMTNCYGCGEQMRTELLHNHIISNHPTYFWDDLFTFQLRDGVMEPLSTLQLREAYNLLHTNAPYKTEPDVYIDFGGNQAYKKIGTAFKHIQKHTDKHVQNYIDTLKQGINKDSLKQLIQFIIHKPLKVIDDENEIQRRVYYQLAEEKSKFHNEISMMREENYRAKLFMGRDEIKEIDELRAENKALLYTVRQLREEQSACSLQLTDWESMRMKSLTQQKEVMDYYEKATKQHKADMKKIQDECDKKTKKYEDECERKIKKAKEELSEMSYKYEEDYNKKIKRCEDECDKKIKKYRDDCDTKIKKMRDELTAKYEKKEKKYKKQIKKYQQEIKVMESKIDNDSSDSSDSSDSDSD